MYVQEFCLTAETEQVCPLVLLEAGDTSQAVLGNIGGER